MREIFLHFFGFVKNTFLLFLVMFLLITLNQYSSRIEPRVFNYSFFGGIGNPVLLCHGYTGNSGVFVENGFSDYLINNSFSVYLVNTTNPTQDINIMSSELKQAVNFVKKHSKENKINLITSSLCGVATRNYLLSEDYDNDLDIVVMVSPPLNGTSALWAYFLIDSLVINQLRPDGEFLRSQNELIPVDKDFVVFTVHGEDDTIVSERSSHWFGVEDAHFEIKNTGHTNIFENIEYQKLFVELLKK